MIKGAFTALITPFDANARIDLKGLDRLIEFQIANRIDGIVAVGTTGESPALTWEEHNTVIEQVNSRAKGRCLLIAGTGSNCTAEALNATRHAVASGSDAILLVDPYYNGPSSLEIRREYIAPIAKAFPATQIIPYIIPGRTGTQLLPADVALLSEKFQNVRSVKEATGDLANIRLTRKLCGDQLSILSGDDNLTYTMRTDGEIRSQGAISVFSNIFPQVVSAIINGTAEEAARLDQIMQPLFGLVTYKTNETSKYGQVSFRARNPLPVKTLMAILGMPSGGCRQPIGRLTIQSLATLLAAARKVYETAPATYQPLADYFKVDVAARLNDPVYHKGLAYAAGYESW